MYIESSWPQRLWASHFSHQLFSILQSLIKHQYCVHDFFGCKWRKLKSNGHEQQKRSLSSHVTKKARGGFRLTRSKGSHQCHWNLVFLGSAFSVLASFFSQALHFGWQDDYQHLWAYSLSSQLHVQWEKDSYFLDALVLVCLGCQSHWSSLGYVLISEPIIVTNRCSVLARLRSHAQLWGQAYSNYM